MLRHVLLKTWIIICRRPSTPHENKKTHPATKKININIKYSPSSCMFCYCCFFISCRCSLQLWSNEAASESDLEEKGPTLRALLFPCVSRLLSSKTHNDERTGDKRKLMPPLPGCCRLQAATAALQKSSRL